MDDQTLTAARDGQREAVVAVLSHHLPAIWRMAVNLTGSEPAGQAAARQVLETAQATLPTWEHADAATRWFRHHTLLTSRSASDVTATEHDPLVRNAGPIGKSAAYTALVTALRKLPHQQREAFLLHHGEGFSDRQLGIAMDCSVMAAGNHLRQAGEVLAPLAGKEYPNLIAAMRSAYSRVTPPEDVAVRYRGPSRFGSLKRRLLAAGLFLGWLALLFLIAAVVFAIFILRDRVDI